VKVEAEAEVELEEIEPEIELEDLEDTREDTEADVERWWFAEVTLRPRTWSTDRVVGPSTLSQARS
jgi:hypothetical protein